MPQIHIQRKKQLEHILQPYSLLVNGKDVGGLKQGDSFTKELPKGKYTFQVKYRLLSSKPLEVELKEGEHFHLMVSSYKYAYLINISWVLIVAFMAYPEIMTTYRDYFFPLLALPVGISLFQKTINRKKYLQFEKVKAE